MHKWYTTVAVLLVSVLLSGCGEKEEIVEVPVSHLHEQSEMTMWDDKTVNAITPCCAFESTPDKLSVYPYYDNDFSVQVEKLLLSENNDFWGAITEQYKSTDNFVTSEGYSLVTLDNGTTVGIIELKDSTCYWVTSSELPSAYVQAVLKQLCK